MDYVKEDIHNLKVDHEQVKADIYQIKRDLLDVKIEMSDMKTILLKMDLEYMDYNRNLDSRFSLCSDKIELTKVQNLNEGVNLYER